MIAEAMFRTKTKNHGNNNNKKSTDFFSVFFNEALIFGLNII